MMVSDFDGNRDEDLIKKEVFDVKYPITAMKASDSLVAAVNTLVTGYTSPNGTKEQLLWQAHIKHDNHLTSKPAPRAKGLEQE